MVLEGRDRKAGVIPNLLYVIDGQVMGEARARIPGMRLAWQNGPEEINLQVYLRRQKRVSQTNLAGVASPKQTEWRYV